MVQQTISCICVVVCCGCRHWLVVNEEGNMVTARQESRLVLVSLTFEGGRAVLNGPDMEELKFPISQPDYPVVNCRCFVYSLHISCLN